MKNFTPELIAKAKAAESAEELWKIAKENNMELSEEEAKTYFEQLNADPKLNDDELEAVAGGCGGTEYQDGDMVRFVDGTTCACGSSTCIVGRAPNLRYGAYLRCTDCHTIIFDHIPYDSVTKC